MKVLDVMQKDTTTKLATKKRLVLRTTLDKIRRYIDLDLILNVSISLSSVVSTYPLVEGDSISDHMYRQPNTITLTGTFSQNSLFSIANSSENRLKNIQRLFERIKDERLFVDIISIFNARLKYVLYNISWTEHANTLDYTFSFKEVYTAKVDEVVYHVSSSDNNLPDVTEPLQLDFTDTLLDWNEIDAVVNRALQDAGLVEENFWFGVQNVISSDAVRTTLVITSIGAALLAKGVIASAITLGISVPVIGWIALGAAVVAASLYFLITALKKKVETKKYRIEVFKYYEDDRKMQAETSRYINFLGEIHTQLELLEETAKVYQFQANVAQTCLLTIDNNYYSFIVTKNNTTGYWSMEIRDMSDNVVGQVSSMIGLSNIGDANDHNKIFVGPSGTTVYLINTKLEEADIYNDSDNMKYYDTLENFVLFVTSINMNEWSNLISDIINGTLLV